MKLGIVGLPNVGKSTLFNAITKAGAESANYPFCTIDPNVGVVAVPDERLQLLSGGNRVRRYCGAGKGRFQGRRPRESVPRKYSGNGRYRARGSLL